MNALTADLAEWLKLRAWVEPKRLQPGERGTLVMQVRIPPGCHIEAHEPSEPISSGLSLALYSPEPVEEVFS